MTAHEIRIYGDPVLKSVASEVTDIDGRIVTLADEMLDVMYDAPGIGLAANQIGIQKKIFVWDLGDDAGPQTIVNPVIAEYGDDEWLYDEACLSIPGLYVEMLRPKTIHVKGIDLDGNEVAFDADELLARLFQHEVDHLNGVVMFERMTPDQRKDALTEWRKIREARENAAATQAADKVGGVRRRLRLK
jgi:peptide deformylase